MAKLTTRAHTPICSNTQKREEQQGRAVMEEGECMRHGKQVDGGNRGEEESGWQVQLTIWCAVPERKIPVVEKYNGHTSSWAEETTFF